MIDRQFRQPHLSSNQSHFSRVPMADIPRSVFNRDHTHKTTFNPSRLVPIYVDEVLPGDSFKMRCTTFARLSTPLTPFMDNLYADVHFWYVPYRLVWENWEAFISSSYTSDDVAVPLDPVEYTIPTLDLTGAIAIGSNSIYDYFGLPILGTTDDKPTISALPFRAYNLIYKTWYHPSPGIYGYTGDATELVVNTDDGPDATTDYSLAYRFKRHDYFTSCLPYPQLGPAVDIPLATDIAKVAPYLNDSSPAFAVANSGLAFLQGATGLSYLDLKATANPTDVQGQQVTGTQTAANALDLPLLSTWGARNDLDYLAADVESAMGTISSLREAIQLQRMLERDLRGGSRYIESLKSHFGVTAPDFRLQRPEYLGGGTTMINQMPIAQTSGTSTATGWDTPQGTLTSMATFSHGGVGFNKSFVEHGIVMGIISVRSDMTYQQGLNRMWTRQTRFDFYWPTFAHLGEQAVLSQELNCVGDTADDNSVFGYQERYAEYRYKPSSVTGLFRSNVSGSLETWHLAYDFDPMDAPYSINNDFLREEVPIGRVIADTNTLAAFLLDCVFSLKCARPMPVYSVPGLMDHF